MAAGKLPEARIPDVAVGRNKPARFMEEEIAESVRNAVGETQVGRGKLGSKWTS